MKIDKTSRIRFFEIQDKILKAIKPKIPNGYKIVEPTNSAFHTSVFYYLFDLVEKKWFNEKTVVQATFDKLDVVAGVISITVKRKEFFDWAVQVAEIIEKTEAVEVKVIQDFMGTSKGYTPKLGEKTE